MLKPVSPSRTSKQGLLLRIPLAPFRLRPLSWMVMTVLLSNFVSHAIWNRKPSSPSSSERVAYHAPDQQLYLLDQASRMIAEPLAFADKVYEVSARLAIEPEWLMAVMYAESSFEATVFNRKGSGAVGLIQFMPATARELNTSPNQLAQMTAIEQLDYVYRYFAQVMDRYGTYESLTDLYLAVLYPKARKQDPCFLLYAKPSQAYRMNKGLDENKDGVVTVSDIDKRMKRLFPGAYLAGNEISL